MDSVNLSNLVLDDAGIGPIFRLRHLEQLGVTKAQLIQLMAIGAVERVERGHFRISPIKPAEQPGLIKACANVPEGIFCLHTALKIHRIGTWLPCDISMAIAEKLRPHNTGAMRIKFVRFMGPALTLGVDETSFGGVPTRVTSPARTVVDCFRYSTLIGIEVAEEALRETVEGGIVEKAELMELMEQLPTRLLKNAVRHVGK